MTDKTDQRRDFETQLKWGKTNRTHLTECGVKIQFANGGLREMWNGFEMLVAKPEG